MSREMIKLCADHDMEAEAVPRPHDGETHLAYAMRVLEWAHFNGWRWQREAAAAFGQRLSYLVKDRAFRALLVKLLAQHAGVAPDMRSLRAHAVAAKVVRRRKAGAR